MAAPQRIFANKATLTIDGMTIDLEGVHVSVEHSRDTIESVDADGSKYYHAATPSFSTVTVTLEAHGGNIRPEAETSKPAEGTEAIRRQLTRSFYLDENERSES